MCILLISIQPRSTRGQQVLQTKFRWSSLLYERQFTGKVRVPPYPAKEEVLLEEDELHNKPTQT